MNQTKELSFNTIGGGLLAKLTTCKEVAALPLITIKNLCNPPGEISENCPQLCPGKSICPCTDFILEFFVNDREITCAKVANYLKKKKQEKFCNKKKIEEIFPGVCTC